MLSTAFPNHKLFVAPAWKLSREGGRLSGDAALLVKNDLAKYVKEICVEYDNIVAL